MYPTRSPYSMYLHKIFSATYVPTVIFTKQSHFLDWARLGRRRSWEQHLRATLALYKAYRIEIGTYGLLILTTWL